MVLRSFLETLLRDRTRRRTLPRQVGGERIVVSAAGGLRMLIKPMEEVDPDLLETARLLVRPGNTVWDIGANIGLFAFSAAGLAGRDGQVFAFEPDVQLVTLLRRSQNLSSDQAAAVSVVPCGAAGATGIRSFGIASRARASNALAEYGNSQMGGTRETQTIVCLSSDAMLDSIPSPDVVKIDIEGAEVELLGASKTLLSEVRPAIAVEVGLNNVDEVTWIFVKFGYKLFDGPEGLRLNRELTKAVWNTLAIPEEKLNKFCGFVADADRSEDSSVGTVPDKVANISKTRAS